MVVTFETAAELVRKLGNIPLERICFTPVPGRATERDLLRAHRRTGRLYELIEGTLVEKVKELHESILALSVGQEVGNHAKEHDLGLVSGAGGPVRLQKGLVRLPDLGFFCWDKFPERLLPSEPIPDLAPDLAVEVLSKGNTPAEMRRKLREYFLAGVRLVWMIDPRRRQASVSTAPDAPAALIDEGQALDGGDVLPGFRLPLAKLFAQLPVAPPQPRKKKS